MPTAELLVVFQDGRWVLSLRHERLGIVEYFHSREVALERARRWVHEHCPRAARVVEPDGSSWTLV